MTTVQQRFPGNDRILQIAVQAHTGAAMPKAIEEVKAVVRVVLVSRIRETNTLAAQSSVTEFPIGNNNSGAACIHLVG